MTDTKNSTPPLFSIIAAHDPDLVIGKNGDLPWHLPEDLKHFKKTTHGYPMLMGRKTYESIGSKPLPGRPCYVLTSRSLDNVTTFRTVDEAIKAFKQTDYQKVFIAGGGTVYEEMLYSADELIISEVKKRYEGDTFFPEYRHQIGKMWHEVKTEDQEDFTIRYYRK